MAALITYFFLRWLDRVRERDAQTKAEEIRRNAEEQAQRLLKDADIEIKKKQLDVKLETEKEMRILREELHERERLLNKRDDALTQQQDQIKRQEKVNEGTQRKLAEKIQETSRRATELDKLIAMQRQTLHQISGLSKEEATRRILSEMEDS
ncbi:MAG: Rnase Y domain-containing protein, partial [Planctomycetia bacterium]|nr:Rnase Y domain-containing protein [Planctomycetia bacterium]